MTPEEEIKLCHEFDLLLERHGKMIDFLCLRASCGRQGYYGELQQECYTEILSHLAQRLASQERQMPEPQWVWWRCRRAISHYQRSVRYRAMLLLHRREAEGGEATHEVTQLTVDELAACLHGDDRRCFLLMVDGASDDELRQLLHLKANSLRQMKSRIKKKLYEYLKQ
jgi:DNA-directed RNA polymerase specialized sigma24 family protein